MKKYTDFFVCCLAMFFSAAAIFAQGFTGPGSGNNGIVNGQAVMIFQPITVSEAKNLPHDSWVVLAGNIINMLPGGRQYTFRDSSGDIAVDIGPKEWRGLSVDMNDRVEIYGEVKISRGQIHIKAHAITGTGRVNARQGQPVTVNRPVTINEAANLPHDSWVILNGNIISALHGSKNYLLRDISGEITVDIGRKEWRGLSAGVSDMVEIYGEVKNHRGQIHVKVHAVRKTGE